MKVHNEIALFKMAEMVRTRARQEGNPLGNHSLGEIAEILRGMFESGRMDEINREYNARRPTGPRMRRS